MKDDPFFEIHRKSLEDGFWTENYKKSIISLLENNYRREILINWFVSDIVINGDKVLLKWDKRIFPLTDEELKSQYNQ